MAKIKSSPLSIFVFAVSFLVDAVLARSLWSKEFEAQVEHRFATQPGSTLKLSNIRGSISVNSWSDDVIQVLATKKVRDLGEEEALKLLDRISIDVQPNGAVAVVKTQGPSGEKEKYNVDYKLMVPRRLNLQLTTDVGDIEVRAVDGIVNVYADVGDVKLTEIEGTIEARTDVGDIEGTQLTGDMDFRTDVGDIKVEEVNGTIGARTDVGGIEVGVHDRSQPAPIKIRTDVGSIELSLPHGFAADLALQTDVGDISSDLPVQVEGNLLGSIPGKKVKGKLNMGGPLIEISSDVGSIRIKEQ
jgi:hypothetical protein